MRLRRGVQPTTGRPATAPPPPAKPAPRRARGYQRGRCSSWGTKRSMLYAHALWKVLEHLLVVGELPVDPAGRPRHGGGRCPVARVRGPAGALPLVVLADPAVDVDAAHGGVQAFLAQDAHHLPMPLGQAHELACGRWRCRSRARPSRAPAWRPPRATCARRRVLQAAEVAAPRLCVLLICFCSWLRLPEAGCSPFSSVAPGWRAGERSSTAPFSVYDGRALASPARTVCPAHGPAGDGDRSGQAGRLQRRQGAQRVQGDGAAGGQRVVDVGGTRRPRRAMHRRAVASAGSCVAGTWALFDRCGRHGPAAVGSTAGGQWPSSTRPGMTGRPVSCRPGSRCAAPRVACVALLVAGHRPVLAQRGTQHRLGWIAQGVLEVVAHGAAGREAVNESPKPLLLKPRNSIGG